MSKYNIGKSLRQFRKIAGYSVKEAATELKLYHIDIAAKTLYGYESGSTMPNAYVFLALCHIYKCANPMAVLGMPDVKPCDITIIRKYRNLDENGKKIIDTLIDLEIARTRELQALRTKNNYNNKDI